MDMPGELSSKSASVDAERCIAELQRGRAIALIDTTLDHTHADAPVRIVQLVEGMDDIDLEALMATESCQLVLSRSRALALDLMTDSNAVCLELTTDIPAQTVKDWAGLNPKASGHSHDQANRLGGIDPFSGDQNKELGNHGMENTRCARAALNLAHQAHALPAFIMYAANKKPAQLLSVSTQSAMSYREQSGKLMKLSSANIPLATAKNVELTVFREQHGNAEHVAITVGEPDFTTTVTVRIHSSCFTGDVLGSMKCDCGEQLQRAIGTMAEGDGGVVLYVSQEGRGIGLASKLLAYQLQDQGLDTIEANEHLGFEADERQYQAAIFMLEQLGINTVRLMTNNPLKIEALRQHGVHVSSRVPSPATVNTHNARYLQTKLDRAGHLTSSDVAG